MTIKIYVCTHKRFTPPDNAIYQPLQVGRALHEDLGYLSDNQGDNISDRNCYYSELTGHYFVWKNCHEDIVGLCHYRRYLIDEKDELLTASQIEELLGEYDLITTKAIQLNYSYYEGFSANHKIAYLDATEEVISQYYPAYEETFHRLVHEKRTFFGNMMIMKKADYDAYMDWLFGILFRVEKRVSVEEEDSYHRRIFGFISEFLLYVWAIHHKISVYSCKVGMVGEKAEVRETKEGLRELFDEGDLEGAREYFLRARKLRPDLMMEASDITGELHLCMEAIAIAGLERRAGKTDLLTYGENYDEILHFLNLLNEYTIQEIQGRLLEEGRLWLYDKRITEEARGVAHQMFEHLSNPYQYIKKGEEFDGSRSNL